MIEQIVGKPLHNVFKERIIAPLELNNTYLEFYQSPKSSAPVVFPHYGTYSLENINTSFDWGAGGLISDTNNLSVFIRSFVNGQLFKKKETLQVMMQFHDSDPVSSSTNRTTSYGLGIQKKEIRGYSFVGHTSAYGAMMFYEKKKNIAIVLSLNQAAVMHKAEWLMNKIVNKFLHNSDLIQ